MTERRVNGRRLTNRDWGRMQNEKIAHRSMLRIVEREHNADVRECYRKWSANAPKAA